MYHTSMGKTTYDTLVLTGGPGGTVYRIKLRLTFPCTYQSHTVNFLYRYPLPSGT